MTTAKKWWALIGISLIFLNVGIDFTIVSTALPTMQAKLNISLVQLQWIMNIYLLFFCISLPAMGYLGDLFGSTTYVICLHRFISNRNFNLWFC